MTYSCMRILDIQWLRGRQNKTESIGGWLIGRVLPASQLLYTSDAHAAVCHNSSLLNG